MSYGHLPVHSQFTSNWEVVSTLQVGWRCSWNLFSEDFKTPNIPPLPPIPVLFTPLPDPHLSRLMIHSNPLSQNFQDEKEKVSFQNSHHRFGVHFSGSLFPRTDPYIYTYCRTDRSLRTQELTSRGDSDSHNWHVVRKH